MVNKKLSVIMCNYNYGHYIEEALRAILNQSFPADEVIVLDDASTDNSVNVIKRIMNEYPSVRLLQNERNMGGGYSAKKALEASSGDYFYSASSDDKVMPEFFEKSMNMLDRYPHAGFCCSDTEFIFNDKSVVKRFGLSNKPTYFPPSEVLELFLKLFIPIPPIISNTVIIKRSALLEAGGYKPELKWSCDLMAHNVVSFRQGFCYIPEVLTKLRIHENQQGRLTGRWHVDKDVIEKAISLVKSDNYRDVLPMFQKLAPFSQSPWEVLKVILRKKEYSFLSFRLLKLAFIDKFIKRILLRLLPFYLYSRMVVKFKEVTRKIMNYIKGTKDRSNHDH